MPTAAYYTLGCKVNQYETEKIRESLEQLGFSTVSFASPADVYIINSCTVTGTADSKSRRAIRQAARRNPGAFVVATGCYAELKAVDVAEIEGVDLVVGNDGKDSIADRVLARFPDVRPNGHVSAHPRTRTRAVVKVQDGCSQFCAYCTVPYARSREWSRPIAQVVDEISALAGFGYKEVILTGIRLGSYSHGLANLVEAVANVAGIDRVRLSSLELWEIDDRLLGLMASNSKICRHLHIPLQSGDARVLAAMGRPYNPEAYRETIRKAREAVRGLGLTTDVIVGFPGETAGAFQRSLEFVDEMQFSRLHVFRYSERPGTRAADMPGKVPDAEKTERSERMISLGTNLAKRFAGSLIGEELPVLVEAKRGEFLSGFTDNYVEVSFDGSSRLRGSIVPVRINRAVENGAEGTITEAEVV